jgi:hypothetical protein
MILITQPRVGKYHNDILNLEMAAKEIGWDVLSAPQSWRLDDNLIKSGIKGVPYGSSLFCETIAQQMNWNLLRNNFDWLCELPIEYTSRKIELMTLGEAKKITERKFIKPVDIKCFDAKIYESGSFAPHESISNDCPTLVSDPVEFTLEYRCFIENFKVHTWSNYIYEDHIINSKFWKKVPEGISHPCDFVQEMLYDIGAWAGRPASIYNTQASVIDVGYIRDKGWAIIETNEAWASGIYGCDPIKVLKVLEKSCE